MKKILLSTRPKWCEKICHEIGTDKNGKPIYEKEIEVRKTKPSIPTPFKVYIYCTKTKNKWSLCDYEGAYQNRDGEIVYAQQHVIGEFICDKVTPLVPLGLRGFEVLDETLKAMCLTTDDLNVYGGLKTLYGWHITDLKIYDKPKELSEFVAAREKDYCDGCGVAWESCNGDYHCTQKHCDGYHLSRAPQSYMYVEEV